VARIDNRGNLRGSASGGGLTSRVQGRKGANDFLALSKRLKEAGRKDLRNELNKAMRTAAKPLIPKVREAARADLPKHGGLNERIAKKPYRAQTRTGARNAGVRIVGSKVDPRINDEGRVFHPVFGHKPGVVQDVPKANGYFSDTLRSQGPGIRDDVVRALGDFVTDLTKRL
jgi:hypothetical protein